MDVLKSTFSAAVSKVESLGGTELERKVKEATSNENWGVSGTVKNEIAQATADYTAFQEVMGVLWARIGQKSNANWRIVFKGLDLLMFLLKNGHHRIIEETRDHMMVVRPLQDFRYTDPNTGLDKGRGIRELSKQVIELMRDTKRLNGMRRDAQKQRSKLGNISGTSASSDNNYGGYGGGGYGGSGGGYNNNSYSGYGGKSRSSDDYWGNTNNTSSSKAYGGRIADYGDDKTEKKKKKKKSHKKEDSWGGDDDPWDESSDRKKKKKHKHKHKKKHHKKKHHSSEDDDESEEEDRSSRKHKSKSKHEKHPTKGMKIEPLDGPKGDVSAQAIAPPTGNRGRKPNNTNNNAINIGDDFGFGNDFGAALPSNNNNTNNDGGGFGFGATDDFSNFNAAPATTTQAPPQQSNNDFFGGGGGGGGGDIFGSSQPAAPATQGNGMLGMNGNSGGGNDAFGFGSSNTTNNDDFGFGASTNTTNAPAANNNDIFSMTNTAPAQQPQPTQPSRPLTMNEKLAQQGSGGGGNSSLFDPSASANLDIFGGSNNTSNAANNNATQGQIMNQNNDVSVSTKQPEQKEAPKKKTDAWDLGGKLLDGLSDLGSSTQKTKMVAFDPDKQKKTSGPLPSLTSYGNAKPDLTGFSMGGGMSSLNNMGMGMQQPPPQQRGGMGMSMNAMGTGMGGGMGMNQMGGGMNRMNGMNQMGGGMNQMGSGMGGMNAMGSGMGGMGMNQMGMGGGMNQMGMGMGRGMNQMGSGMGGGYGGNQGGGFMGGNQGGYNANNRNQPKGGIGPFF